jgi:hypothetical protein
LNKSYIKNINILQIMDVDLLDIVTDKFRHNIKRSIFIKEMKQYGLDGYFYF